MLFDISKRAGETLLRTLQRAADEAHEKGVEVHVHMEQTGFFSNERNSVTVTVRPERVKGGR